jgi:hypothetical protein
MVPDFEGVVFTSAPVGAAVADLGGVEVLDVALLGCWFNLDIFSMSSISFWIEFSFLLRSAIA